MTALSYLIDIGTVFVRHIIWCEKMIRNLSGATASKLFLRNSRSPILILRNAKRTFSEITSEKNKEILTLEQLDAVRHELLGDIKKSENRLLEDRYKAELRMREEIKTAEERYHRGIKDIM